MRTTLAVMLLTIAASAYSQQVARPDVPDVQDDFWNTSERCQKPVCVDQCAAMTALTALETRNGTRSASAAIDDLDSRFMTRDVSNRTDILDAAPFVILVR